MIEFKANALYSLQDLEEMLDGVVALGTFLDRLDLRTKRVFKGAVWGSEILQAVRKARPFSESTSDAANVINVGGLRPGRKGSTRGPVRELSRSDLDP